MSQPSLRQLRTRRVELESDASSEQRDTELVEADALSLGLGGELRVEGDGESQKELAGCFHEANGTTDGIDIGSTARNTVDMTKRTITVRMEIEIDEEVWATEYGTPVSSVEDYVLNQIWGSPAAEAGAIAPSGYVVEGL